MSLILFFSRGVGWEEAVVIRCITRRVRWWGLEAYVAVGGVGWGVVGGWVGGEGWWSVKLRFGGGGEEGEVVC